MEPLSLSFSFHFLGELRGIPFYLAEII